MLDVEIIPIVVEPTHPARERLVFYLPFSNVLQNLVSKLVNL
jgi:hypothetical protein